MSGMAEVLRKHHADGGYNYDLEWQICTCGTSYGPRMHDTHVADALTAAGFGPVKEAKAVALEEAADEVTCGTQEIPGNDYANTGLSDAVLWHEVRSWLRATAAAVRGDGA